MAREYSRKAALVTGGAQGIGRASAELLAARGYDVLIADRDAEAGREAGAASGLAFLGAVMAVEKNAAWGRKLTAPLGAALVAWGLTLVLLGAPGPGGVQ